MDSKPTTPLSEQSDKVKKYDRQLRLWGDHGQALLESAHVCVCGASASLADSQTGSSIGASSVLGTEVLRSIVLPGVGKITVLDDAKLSNSDFGNNLLVCGGKIGAPRGEVLLQSLLEMNPDVRGNFVDHTIEGVLETELNFFNDFTLVVAVNLQEKPLIELSEVLWRLKVPLLVVKSYGLIGYMRIQIEEQTIIESHPENEIPDLRLFDPFPALKEYFNNINLEMLDDKQHSHIPYVVVLYKYLQKWIEEHGEPPKNYKEKKLLGQMIKLGMREKTAVASEENFDEAVKAINTNIKSDNKIPSYLRELFTKIPSPLTLYTKPFWLVLEGIKKFVEDTGRLPVTGVLSDMTADSASYIALQNIYREQASLDCETVFRHTLDVSQQITSVLSNDFMRESNNCRNVCTEVTPENSALETKVPEALVRSICRHASNLRVIRGKSVSEEYGGKVDLGISAEMELINNDIVWYILLRAVDLFHSEFRCYPGFESHQVETDIVRLKVCVNKLIAEWGGSSSIGVKDDHIHEMCRYGAAQIHSVASFIGGCAAHEIIKLITHQYVPVDNTFIYNAATATTLSLSL